MMAAHGRSTYSSTVAQQLRRSTTSPPSASDPPRNTALRKQRLEHGQPIAIAADVWIGGGALILPGITVAMMRLLEPEASSREMLQEVRR
jgi:hypothetical protein